MVLMLVVVMLVVMMLVVIVRMIMMRMIMGIQGQHPDVVIVAATTGQAHDSTSSSTERTRSSRPATRSTSALPQSHSKMRLSSAKSWPQVRQCAAPRVCSITSVEPSKRRTADDELVTELHRVGHNARQCADIQSHPVNPPAGSPLDDHVDNALGNGKLVH